MVHCPTLRPVLSRLWDTDPGSGLLGRTGVVYSMKMKALLGKRLKV